MTRSGLFSPETPEKNLAVTAATKTFATAVAAMTADPSAARVALAQMGETIEIHLAHEEADLLPLIPDAFSAVDLASFQAESAETDPLQAFLACLLDDASEVDPEFFTEPIPARLRAHLESHSMPHRRMAVEALGLDASAVSAG